MSSWFFSFLWWPWTVTHAILWIHGCWILICFVQKWMWRFSLKRSRSIVSSGATSLFSWRWWSSCWWSGIHIWKVLIWYIIRFWIIQRLSLWFLWSLCMGAYSLTRYGPSPLSLFLWWVIFIGIGICWGSGDEGRKGNHSRDVLSGNPLFVCHQQVMEEDILVVGQFDLAVQQVQEVPEVHLVQKEHQDHQRILAETDNWSHLLLRSQVICWGWRPLFSFQPLSTRADQMRCWKSWMELQDNPPR